MRNTPKQCTECKRVLPRSAFHVAGIGSQGKCKSCVVSYIREWRKNNPELLAKQRRDYKRKWKARMTPEQRRATYRRDRLNTAYGITPAEYDAIFAAQGGGCAICGGLNKSNHRLHVDHDHETGENRGLLCSQCNTALERLESVSDWHVKAINYLAKYLTVRMDKSL